MKVKRAGLGGTGYMLDPFDPEAMKLHVAQFDKWFGKAAQSVTCEDLVRDDSTDERPGCRRVAACLLQGVDGLVP